MYWYKIKSKREYADMFDKCSKIRKLLIASINTAKGIWWIFGENKLFRKIFEGVTLWILVFG